MTGRVHSINMSDGGVPKLPVAKAIIDSDGLAGDVQADRRHHGGPDKAVCLFSLEVIERFQAEGHPMAPGSAGENLTVSGIDWAVVVPGTHLRIGEDVVLEIVDPATPCSKNAQWFTDRDFRRMDFDLHPGQSRMYARVLAGGAVAQGDPVAVL